MLDHRVVWLVAALMVAAVLGAAFAFGVVTLGPSHHHEDPLGVTIKAPGSGPKAIGGGR
jgi:hypothetical protein